MHKHSFVFLQRDITCQKGENVMKSGKISAYSVFGFRTLVIFFFGFFTLLVLSFAIRSSAKDYTVTNIYRSIQIESGDTITSIALANLKDSGLSLDDMMGEIRRLNGLRTDIIYEGAFLVVPVEVRLEG